MKFSVVPRPLATLILFAGLLTGVLAGTPALARQVDPGQYVPLDKIAAQYREGVAEVIREHTFHRKSEADTFPCHPRLYLSLINEPSLTLALWKDLSTSPVALKRVGPNSYHGSDGSGATATWDFVFRSPQMHVLYCNLDYVSPRGSARLDGRIVLIVHSGFYREANGDPWVKHDIEAFVKVDSKGWKTVARTIRPLIEKVLEDQVREAGLFVSLMGGLVVTYPNWACQVTQNQPEINPTTRDRFREIVLQAKRPDASPGRPAVADNAATRSVRRR